MVNPSEFYFIYEENHPTLLDIQKYLYQYGKDLRPITKTENYAGRLCVVQNHGKFFRARIECDKLAQEVLVRY